MSVNITVMHDPIYESKYYIHGPVDNLKLYGLYDPIGDCFLIVLPNKNIIKELKCILSSRYNLHICQLDTAKNFSETQINNSHCESWSLTNKNHIDVSYISEKIVSVTDLCPSPKVFPYDVVREKMWCLFCAYWLYKSNSQPWWFDPHWGLGQINRRFDTFLQITEVTYRSSPPLDHKLQEFRPKILRLLYLGSDIDQTAEQIQKLVDDVT